MLNDTQIAIARQILNLGGKLDTKFSTMFIEEVESLQQQNKQMKEALEFYGDANNYAQELIQDVNHTYWEAPEVLNDNGILARQTLQSLQGGTDNANG